ncbi:MAG TPA: hypothetical protein P5509_06875, partial [Bacteroidales bacterium]|nr:hypothetical protein [Bacteroidales bacterium]
YAYTITLGGGYDAGFGYHFVESETFPKSSQIQKELKEKYPDCSIIINGFNEFNAKEDYDNFRS